MFCLFRQGNASTRVFYDDSGNWQYTLISYPPSNLVKEIQDQVSRAFEGYQITYVNKLLSDGESTIYIINIENATDIKVIKVAGDNIKVQQALEKR